MITEPWASYQIRKIAGCACARNAGNDFPNGRLQRKPLASDPDMHHGTCVTHVPRCMSGSLTRGGGENVPGISGACAPAILRIWQEAHALHSLPVRLIWANEYTPLISHSRKHSPSTLPLTFIGLLGNCHWPSAQYLITPIKRLFLSWCWKSLVALVCIFNCNDGFQDSDNLSIK